LEIDKLTDKELKTGLVHWPMGQAGKFLGEVELFYADFRWQHAENKRDKSGMELATLEAVGEASRGSL